MRGRAHYVGASDWTLCFGCEGAERMFLVKAFEVRVDCLRPRGQFVDGLDCTGKHVSLRGSISLVQPDRPV